MLVACGAEAMPELGAGDAAPATTTTSSIPSTTSDDPTSTTEAVTTTDAPVTTTGAASSDAPSTTEAASTTVAETTTAAAAAGDSSSSTTTPATSSTTTTTTTTTAPAEFSSRILEIDDTIAARLSASWRPGCPVELADLRLLELAHWNFDDRVSVGELVVHADHADDLVSVFAALFDVGFPIERMELVDVYDGDDDRSMAANNTSAFNCREVAWKPGVWSNHAFGAAIDINPLINPYVAGPNIFPPEGEPFADRSVRATGGLYPGDAAVQAFYDIGWGWGGTWSGAKDWQHFSASGN